MDDWQETKEKVSDSSFDTESQTLAFDNQQLPAPRAFRWRWLSDVLEIAFTVIAIYSLVNLLSMRYIVHGRSMVPAFEEGQFLIVSRVHYWLEEPERGDFVVFHAPRQQDEDYIKRVIGVPGDLIEFRGQQIHVNGEPIVEAYLSEPCNPARCPDTGWWNDEIVPEDSYFVLGDNRNSSVDSRSRGVGFVDRELLVGKVIFRYWPLDELGFLNINRLASP